MESDIGEDGICMEDVCYNLYTINSQLWDDWYKIKSNGNDTKLQSVIDTLEDAWTKLRKVKR